MITFLNLNWFKVHFISETALLHKFPNHLLIRKHSVIRKLDYGEFGEIEGNPTIIEKIAPYIRTIVIVRT